MKSIIIGKTQEMTVKRTSDFGLYLGYEKEEETVLLPKKQTGTLKVGDRATVFVYKDSEDRPVATVTEPYAQAGEFAYLKVKAVSKIGAFLDWGLEKDLFLPFKEQECPLKPGNQVCVYVYIDKTGRLAASMKLYDHLSAETSEYRQGDEFSGFVYRTTKEVGVFTAVKPKGAENHHLKKLYFGLIPAQQAFGREHVGDEITGRIARVRQDGKLDLSDRLRVREQLDADGELILKKIDEYDGELPFSENASPEIIKRELQMSKNSFKKALGHLLKEGRISIGEKSVTRK